LEPVAAIGGGRADRPTLVSVRADGSIEPRRSASPGFTAGVGATEEKLVPIHGVQAYSKPAARTACACLCCFGGRRCGLARATERPAGGPPAVVTTVGAGSGSLGVLGGPVSRALRKALGGRFGRLHVSHRAVGARKLGIYASI
jgi:hypothetical protein